MIRHAIEEDIPVLAQWMVDLKERTAWAKYHAPTYNLPQLTAFIQYQLLSPRSIAFVDETDGELTAFCGGALQSMVLPPYQTCILEWGWSGTPKAAVRCWQAVCEWGREHGAELAGRVQSKPGTSSQKIIEQVIWKVL